MTAAVELLSELKARGVELQAVGDRLRVRPVEAIGPELLEQVRQHKAEIITIITVLMATASAWPPASLEAERRFGQPHARLFPFVNKVVWTPAGTGKLLSVYAETCEVLPDGTTRTMRVPTADVRPIQ